MRRLRQLLRRALPPAPDPPRLDRPVFVIGDVHGRDDLLAALLARIGSERIVLAGDLIDRGPQSAAVLARMRTATALAPERIFCLMGNHERMLLDALDAPETHGPRWLAHGGAETLASFGLPAEAGGGASATERLESLRAALPEGTEAWLRARPLFWQEGPLGVTHAGADPALPIAAQPEAALLWGHRDFLRRPRSDGIWVAHGHTIVATPQAEAGRIAVDTGAWATGRLTAARIGPEGVSFLEQRG